jgi:hypothetical protein
MCTSCALGTIAARKDTYHNGLKCPTCPKISHIKGVELCSAEERRLIESAIGNFNIRQCRSDDGSRSLLRAFIENGFQGTIPLTDLDSEKYRNDKSFAPMIRLDVARLEQARLDGVESISQFGGPPLPLGPLKFLSFERDQQLERKIERIKRKRLMDRERRARMKKKKIRHGPSVGLTEEDANDSITVDTSNSQATSEAERHLMSTEDKPHRRESGIASMRDTDLTSTASTGLDASQELEFHEGVESKTSTAKSKLKSKSSKKSKKKSGGGDGRIRNPSKKKNTSLGASKALPTSSFIQSSTTFTPSECLPQELRVILGWFYYTSRLLPQLVAKSAPVLSPVLISKLKYLLENGTKLIMAVINDAPKPSLAQQDIILTHEFDLMLKTAYELLVRLEKFVKESDNLDASGEKDIAMVRTSR